MINYLGETVTDIAMMGALKLPVKAFSVKMLSTSKHLIWKCLNKTKHSDACMARFVFCELNLWFALVSYVASSFCDFKQIGSVLYISNWPIGKKKVNRKVWGVPQSQTATNPRHQEEEKNDNN